MRSRLLHALNTGKGLSEIDWKNIVRKRLIQCNVEEGTKVNQEAAGKTYAFLTRFAT